MNLSLLLLTTKSIFKICISYATKKTVTVHSQPANSNKKLSPKVFFAYIL